AIYVFGVVATTASPVYSHGRRRAAAIKDEPGRGIQDDRASSHFSSADFKVGRASQVGVSTPNGVSQYGGATGCAIDAADPEHRTHGSAQTGDGSSNLLVGSRIAAFDVGEGCGSIAS